MLDPPGIDGGWESVAMEMLTGKPSLCTWDVDTKAMPRPPDASRN